MLDCFPEDFLLIMTGPDRPESARDVRPKRETPRRYGFRLPSRDGQPSAEEMGRVHRSRISRAVYLSTGVPERALRPGSIEQIINHGPRVDHVRRQADRRG